MEFIQHLPAGYDQDLPRHKFKFSSIAELHLDEFICNFKKHNGFMNIKIESNGDDKKNKCVIAYYDFGNGVEWRVLGFITNFKEEALIGES